MSTSYSINLQQLTPDASLDSSWLEDGALHYGYGGFETMAVTQGRPHLLSWHLERLSRTAHFLKIPLPFSDEAIKKHVHDLCKGHDRALLKGILTAGSRWPNHRFDSPKLIMSLSPILPEMFSRVSVTLAQDPFPRSEWDTHKTLSYAKAIWHRKSLNTDEDVVFFDEKGQLLEATTSTLFLVRGTQLLTPNHPFILPGIMRRWILEKAARYGLTVSACPLTKQDFEDADAAFLTSSLRLRWITQKSVVSEINSQVEHLVRQSALFEG